MPDTAAGHPHKRGLMARAGAAFIVPQTRLALPLPYTGVGASSSPGCACPIRGMVGARVVECGGVGPCGCPGVGMGSTCGCQVGSIPNVEKEEEIIWIGQLGSIRRR